MNGPARFRAAFSRASLSRLKASSRFELFSLLSAGGERLRSRARGVSAGDRDLDRAFRCALAHAAVGERRRRLGDVAGKYVGSSILFLSLYKSMVSVQPPLGLMFERQCLCGVTEHAMKQKFISLLCSLRSK